MIDTIKSSAFLGDPRDERRPPRQHPDAETQTAPAAGPAPVDARPEAHPDARPDMRLVIEPDGERGGLSYKLIDRTSGQLISAVSREELIRISADPSYTAGKLINTKA